jgi:hypothetical protein
MKRPKKTPKRHDHLEEAVALLLNNQAKFLERLADIEQTNAQRFALIEQHLVRIETILVGLPEAVRQKIGFKPAK